MIQDPPDSPEDPDRQVKPESQQKQQNQQNSDPLNVWMPPQGGAPPPWNIDRDPYPRHRRNLVVQVADHAGIRSAYENDSAMNPRSYILGLDPSLDSALPESYPAQLLFRPDIELPTGVGNDLYSFVAFPVSDLGEARIWKDKIRSRIGESSKVLARCYIQGLFGSSSVVVEAWDERDVGLQDYLQPARYGGIDAMFAWSHGAKGQDETLFVMESGCWCDHLEFMSEPASASGLGSSSVTTPFPGPEPDPDLLHSRQHGTSTLGVVLATENTRDLRKGVVGIAHQAKAQVSLVAPGCWDSSPQFSNMVATVLNRHFSSNVIGSVVLLEMCYMPVGTNVWLPVETEPYVNAALKWFLSSTAVVIQAAGNSDVDLDNVWKAGSPYFEPEGSAPAPTGAIIVGASRSKAPFAKTLLSNYNGPSRLVNTGKGFDMKKPVEPGKVHLFAWGEKVYTTSVELNRGSSDPPDPANDFVDSYTYMSGTSAAAAIVAGAALCIQSVAEKRLDNQQMLEHLIDGGAPCQPGAGIGVQPDLKPIISKILNLP
jgi:hypothetical protein